MYIESSQKQNETNKNTRMQWTWTHSSIHNCIMSTWFQIIYVSKCVGYEARRRRFANLSNRTFIILLPEFRNILPKNEFFRRQCLFRFRHFHHHWICFENRHHDTVEAGQMSSTKCRNRSIAFEWIDLRIVENRRIT